MSCLMDDNPFLPIGAGIHPALRVGGGRLGMNCMVHTLSVHGESVTFVGVIHELPLRRRLCRSGALRS
jgi:hypothetical protein